ncbi:MAG: hypothetical protein H7281_12490 [Bacteriovorax sp.]|nr:hypothetical protein [Bacteriovorax sp.]
MNTENEIVDFDSIDVFLLSGNLKNNPQTLKNIYIKAFNSWHETWNDFYHNEHHSNNKLNSNEFTRQDEILALFYKGECFAVTFFKEVNWEDPTARLDAYFNPWNEVAIKGLNARGNNILICSQFTVSKSFRHRKSDIPWKYILSGFNMKKFLESPADVMTGTMRVKKGMGKMSLEAGATLLASSVICADHEEEPADLVAFFHDEVQTVYEKNIYHLKVDSVWERLNGRIYSQLRLVA